VEKEIKMGREKYWDELDDSGKIERLRGIVKEQQRFIEKMVKYFDKLIDHDHLNGKMIARIRHPNEESYGSPHHRKYRDEYF